MPHNCCVPHCRNNTKQRHGISFHCFPRSPEIRNQWIQSIAGDVGSLFHIGNATRVCSAHFLESDFRNAPHLKLRMLKVDAVPSLFPWTPGNPSNSVMDPDLEIIEDPLTENNTEPSESDYNSEQTSQPESVETPTIQDPSTTNCCVPQCYNEGIFKCPDEGALRRKWRKAIRRADLKYGLQWRPTDSDYICESHFTENDIVEEESEVTGKVKKLKPNAIPSVFVRTSAVDTNERMFREMSKLSVGGNQDEFLENWNPESSNRETRKLTRKIYNQGSRKLTRYYDATGLLRSSGKDVCDCLVEDCPGCHFPCPKCTSPKCGHECRIDRRWVYDHLEIDGVAGNIRNPYR